MGAERFEELVSEALDLIPSELARAIDNVVILVVDRHPEEPELLGLYQGVALTERDSMYAGAPRTRSPSTPKVCWKSAIPRPMWSRR